MRETLQKKLSEIEDLKVGPEESDDILVINENYFSFSFDEIFMSQDFDGNVINRIDFIGYLKRKKDLSENTLYQIDKMADTIIETLRKLNFKCSTYDVSSTSNSDISKIKITGNAIVVEKSKKIIF